MSSDLLFEIGTEELPSGSVLSLAKDLAQQMAKQLQEAGIHYSDIQHFATPRRLAILVKSVAAHQPEQIISKRGPALQVSMDANGNPTQALLGFAKACGASIEELSQKQTDKGTWWVYENTQPGAQTETLLPSLVSQAVSSLTIAKPMRWGQGDLDFVRPVHWAVLLYGETVIKADILGVVSGRQSYGHRFHHPQSIEISSPADYESTLAKAYVVADFAKRRQLIIDQVQQLAKQHGYQAVMPNALIDEVTSIVEWPEALMAYFSEQFLEVPAEALIASMQSHQKCFALQNSEGALVPYFVTVSNIKSERPNDVISGNQKVMQARLSDAAFFFNQDQRKPLSDYIPRTAQVVFQEKLGSLQDKTKRVAVNLERLIQPLALNPVQAQRAAELSKCDLMTGMVGEFPELQGLMGFYYARHDAEEEAVAIALNEQYMPRFAADALPDSLLGKALSLADRLDTLVGIFAIGKKPSGVKDPFKLRRHALAVARILMSISYPLNLSTLIEHAVHAYGQIIHCSESMQAELKLFILERMQSYLQHQGMHAEWIQAVRARQNDWLYDSLKRVQAIKAFAELPAANSLSAACKRVNNLLQQAQDIDNEQTVDSHLFILEEEKALFEALNVVQMQIHPLFNQGAYSQILKSLAELREPVDQFFDHVMVMVDDLKLRHNRLLLLKQLQIILQSVADISLLSWGHE